MASLKWATLMQANRPKPASQPLAFRAASWAGDIRQDGCRP